MVVSARNPVHSVLFLILAFFNAAGLFVLLGAEFLAMILVIVYVGAVAVLFLFVVMMLDINFAELRSGFLHYLPIGALIGLVLLVELLLVFGAWVIAPGVAGDRRRRRCRPTPQLHQHARRSASCSTPATSIAFQAAGHDPAGRDDRRDRADPAPARGCAPAADRRAAGARPRARRSRSSRCRSAQAPSATEHADRDRPRRIT